MSRGKWSWLPNAFTAANVALGFLSILVSVAAFRRPGSFSGPGGAPPFDTACWLILWACIFDVLDGKVAKLLGVSSDFGMRLDTFADATTFGLAPAVLIYGAMLGRTDLPPMLAFAVCGAYFTAAVFRLARYNVLSAGAPTFGFVGLPTPTAAMVATSLYLATRDHSSLQPYGIALCMAALAAVMVSPLRYPSFKGLYPREKKVVLVLLVSMLVLTTFLGAAKVVLIYFGSLALLWGPFWIPTRHLWVPELMRGRKGLAGGRT